MRRIASWWRFWVTLFSRREPATSLACFRIAVGLVLIYSLVSIWTAGLIDVLWIDSDYGGYAKLGGGTWLLRWLGGPTPEVVHGVHAAALVGAVLVTLGAGGRLVILATLQLYIALIRINGDTSGGYDIMLTNALWLLFLGDASATLSLHCRRVAGRWRRDIEISAWPRYLLVFQLIVIYTSTGLYKFTPDWTPGGGFTALYHVFQEPTWRRFDMTFTAWIYPLTQVGTAITWLWETSSILLLLVYYYRYTRDRAGRIRRAFNRWDLRKPFTLVGVGLHLGILILLNVGPFSWISFAFYLCLWHPRELEAGAGRLRRLVFRVPREPTRSSVSALEES